MKFLQGHLLVAAASLRDPNFFHTVVLLVRHNEEGAFGLVLNRPSNTTVSEVWGQISSLPCVTPEVIRVGGPIQGPLMALHGNPLQKEIEVMPGLFFSASREQLEELVGEPDPSARYFVGYAGWAADQLEQEMEAGAWLTLPTDAERLFPVDDEKFWERVTREVGGSQLISTLGIKHVPPDPRYN